MSRTAEERFSRPRGILLLWAGVLIAPLAWALHLMLSYVLVGWACTHDARFLLHVISIVLLAAAAGGGYLAWGNWQRAGRGWPDASGGVLPRTRFMALGGLLLSALFFLVILGQWIPMFILDPCQR